MSIEMLNRIVEQEKSKLPLPVWVSKKNASFLAYEDINKLKGERSQYISEHNLPKDFIKKGDYQITSAEVARNIGIANATLTGSNNFSPQLKKYLAEINEELEQLKNKKTESYKRRRSNGVSQRNKDEIAEELKETRAKLNEIMTRNAVVQAETVLAALTLPIKHALGMSVTK